MSTRLNLPLYTVDAFADVPFSGNPAAVCLDPEGLDDDKMQSIAAEMNLSDTAFVTLIQDEESFSTGHLFGIRWFTPVSEVSLCGHATIAAAAVLFREVGNSNKEITFRTKSRGDLKVYSTDGMIGSEFPLSPAAHVDITIYQELIEVMLKDAPVKDVLFDPLNSYLLIRLDDTFTREQLEMLPIPNGKDAISAYSEQIKGVIVTTKGNNQSYDFYSRFFAPWLGIDEDPVTGSAYTVLGPYWSGVLNQKRLKCRQVSKRGGDLLLTLKNDQVEVKATAVVVIRGAMSVS